jgi:hypothetical protein
MQSTSPHPISLRSILIKSTHLSIDLPSVFLLAFPQYAFLSCQILLHILPLHTHWVDDSNYVWQSPSLCSIFLRSRYSLQHWAHHAVVTWDLLYMILNKNALIWERNS